MRVLARVFIYILYARIFYTRILYTRILYVNDAECVVFMTATIHCCTGYDCKGMRRGDLCIGRAIA